MDQGNSLSQITTGIQLPCIYSYTFAAIAMLYVAIVTVCSLQLPAIWLICMLQVKVHNYK